MYDFNLLGMIFIELFLEFRELLAFLIFFEYTILLQLLLLLTIVRYMFPVYL